ncbi:hypothetical protein M5X00_26120 [Paenibacillus alvei]|uniref:hypothetical protein n=1 Tax=Paenibacillus alvei TaxID=44250 RepID=UPI000287A40A|nr:hypothetical protein [Paenibacillus alvei]EJW13908.1 hypothetical protein PAV_141p00140 [Paenibacillus alvei DSM 29]MCY9707727.1 hypothetical protein [Paenibacillus alvei]MCY9757708.1 hypothetical protein [Paenibacillus alvei]MEC0082760.1 hypothetical protein [Paenibacillus alvei]
MSTVAEKLGGNIVIDFNAFTDKKKIINALNKKPVKFSEMSEKDRYETMQAMRDED